MTGSFLARHRTICAVLIEIRNMAHNRKDAHTIALCEEAITYAQRMSSKLVEYKQTTNERLDKLEQHSHPPKDIAQEVIKALDRGDESLIQAIQRVISP